MTPMLAARLPMLALVITMAAPLRAEDAPPDATSLPVREFRLEHVDVKEANAIVRSILNVRKSAVDLRRQAFIVSDSEERLDQVAAILAKVDAETPEWRVALVAHGDGRDTTLRTASITQGALQLQYGSSLPMNDSLALNAGLRRAASGEIEMEWSVSVSMPDRWSETARAVETLHDGATVVILQTDSPPRRTALSNLLLGVQGAVESLTLEVTRTSDAPPPRRHAR